MTFSTPPPVLPDAPAAGGSHLYHRLAHATGRHRWWRPLVGTVMVLAGWFLLIAVVDAFAYGIGTAKGYPETPDGGVDFGPVANTAQTLGSLALGIPVVLLTVRWVGRRPAGTVSSVDGRLRKRWLALCVLVAVPVVALGMVGMLLMPSGETSGAADEVWVGLHRFLPALVMLLVLVPLQAAAEEYVCRGWLVQAVGGFFRSPWIAVLPQAVLFASLHGWGTTAGFIDLIVFGGVAGWLTVRTGGLEAATALHAVNNLASFAVGAAFVGGLDSDETAADAPWQMVAVDTAVTLVFAAAVLWLARRRWPHGAVSSPTTGPAGKAPHSHEHAYVSWTPEGRQPWHTAGEPTAPVVAHNHPWSDRHSAEGERP
ncbi:lysostaphin resistance A-like protein [Streptomyces sp. NPDC049687]|uniref:lysostaphin resistance A-like protein n=1 Tax=Streptomyces sp. NPDC049687 TaxID=3365596 RepID=UPI0037B5B04C